MADEPVIERRTRAFLSLWRLSPVHDKIFIMNNDLINAAEEFKKGSLGEKFEILTNASPDCIKLFNIENKVEYMNPGGLAEHGFKSLDEALGFDWTMSVVPEQKEEISQKIRECVRDKKTITFDVHHLHEFANREWCSMSISPVFNERGEVKYFIGVSRDISDRKKMEDDINNKRVELEKFNKFMVDRELMMVELKRENEELKKRLDERCP